MKRQVHKSSGDNIAGNKFVYKSSWLATLLVFVALIVALLIAVFNGNKTVGINGDNNVGNNVTVGE